VQSVYLFVVRDPANLDADTNSVVTVFTGSSSLQLEPQTKKNVDVMVTSNVWLKTKTGEAVIFKNKADKPGMKDTDLPGVVERVTTRGVIVRLADLMSWL
jgi:hypothetical protein